MFGNRKKASKIDTGTPPRDAAEVQRSESTTLSRRAALAKIGIRAGAGIIAALSVDDLARLATHQLDQRAQGNKVAHRLARDFQNAGVAFADGTVSCSHCYRQYDYDTTACGVINAECVADANGDQTKLDNCATANHSCMNDANYAAETCEAAHCP